MRVQIKSAVVVEVALNAYDCAACGVVFAITEEFERRRREDAKTFYCPNGHAACFGTSEMDKLRERVASLQGDLNHAWERVASEQMANVELGHQLRAQKAAKTRILKRVQNGVCPHCRRHFTNVERHMATKHPSAAAQRSGA